MTFTKLHTHELKRPDIAQYKMQPKLGIILMADRIRSGHNVGSIFRIADSFAFEAIALGGYTVKPPHKEIQKTAIGATESVPWLEVENEIEYLLKLKKEGYKIIALEQTSSSIALQNYQIDKNQKYLIILGNEVDGVSEALLQHVDECIEIPQNGTKHSLNVSVAAGIISWHFYAGISF